MGMSRNQLKLVKAVAENNFASARICALACCEEDSTQKNHFEVNRYKNILLQKTNSELEVPLKLQGLVSFENVVDFQETRYFVTEEEKGLFDLIARMDKAALLLMEKKIHYLNATLLHGISGVGKTTFGRYVAYKLGLPLLCVNLSQIFDSYLGKTSKNLDDVFSFAKQTRCVLLLDEIDCISSKRTFASDSAGKEIARMTTCLLQMLDDLPNDHILIGTTNILQDIDSAVRRRFSVQHEIKKLNAVDMESMVRNYLTDTGFRWNEEQLHSFVYSFEAEQATLKNVIVRKMAEALMENSDFVTFLP